MTEDDTIPEEAKEGLKQTLHKLLVTDSVSRIKYVEGKLDKDELEEIVRGIVPAVCAIVLQGLVHKEAGEELHPILMNKVTEGVGDPFLPLGLAFMLAIWHRMECGDQKLCIKWAEKNLERAEKRVDMDQAVEEWQEMKEEVPERLRQLQKREEDLNVMFA